MIVVFELVPGGLVLPALTLEAMVRDEIAKRAALPAFATPRRQTFKYRPTKDEVEWRKTLDASGGPDPTDLEWWL